MKTVILVDENNNPVEKREVNFGNTIPRVGEHVSVVRCIEGNVKIVDGEHTAKSVIDKIDKYKVIEVDHIIKPTSNRSTNIDIKIVVSLMA